MSKFRLQESLTAKYQKEPGRAFKKTPDLDDIFIL